MCNRVVWLLRQVASVKKSSLTASLVASLAALGVAAPRWRSCSSSDGSSDSGEAGLHRRSPTSVLDFVKGLHRPVSRATNLKPAKSCQVSIYT
jgi:hypothetical protein